MEPEKAGAVQEGSPDRSWSHGGHTVVARKCNSEEEERTSLLLTSDFLLVTPIGLIQPEAYQSPLQSSSF